MSDNNINTLIIVNLIINAFMIIDKFL